MHPNRVSHGWCRDEDNWYRDWSIMPRGNIFTSFTGFLYLKPCHLHNRPPRSSHHPGQLVAPPTKMSLNLLLSNPHLALLWPHRNSLQWGSEGVVVLVCVTHMVFQFQLLMRTVGLPSMLLLLLLLREDIWYPSSESVPLNITNQKLDTYLSIKLVVTTPLYFIQYHNRRAVVYNPSYPAFPPCSLTT